MIELRHDQLAFAFPEVHQEARLAIEFQRTLRIPDDDKRYPLPPGLGRFPLRHVDDFAPSLPQGWLEHGGVMLPMYQAEALWLRFVSVEINEHWVEYPFAIKIATGKIDAVTGKTWSEGLSRYPQDYLVAPTQPWLDGYSVEKGTIRQFVAMPLGEGYSAEEQLTGKAEHGGLQIAVYPMKRSVFERRFPKRERQRYALSADALSESYCLSAGAADMGLAPGGRMNQEIYEDEFDLSDWDLDHKSRCFVHIANSQAWRAITGQEPPNKPPNAREYSRAGLPWFDYYDEKAKPLEGSKTLQSLDSVALLGRKKRQDPLPENDSCTPTKIVEYRKNLKEHQVREGVF